MPDQYQETTHTSWFQRIKNSFIGVVVGFIFFITSFPILIFNERNAVLQIKGLKEIEKKVISINPEVIDSQNGGKVVHATAPLKVTTNLTDDLFNIQELAIKLRRTVYMFQWVEKQHSTSKNKLGGGQETVTTYSYSKEWSPVLISSEQFKKPEGHINPSNKPYNNLELIADNVQFGAFTMPKELVGALYNYDPLPVTPAMFNAIENEDLKFQMKPFQGALYQAANPELPEIGDVKIEFSIIRPSDVSIIARQINSTFEPYLTEKGVLIQSIMPGTLSSETMIGKLRQENLLHRWMFRFMGFMFMWIGLMTMLKPLKILAVVVPLLGTIVGYGIGLVAFIITLLLASITIAISWLSFRPFMSFMIIIGSLIISFLLYGLIKKRKPKHPIRYE